MKQLSFDDEDSRVDPQEIGQLIDAIDRLDQTIRELVDVLREEFGLWVAGGK